MLSKAAVTNPGSANIDRIDGERGEIAHITQILGVAAGNNVISGDISGVTAGLIQVDLDGGGNNWVTLSTINGSASVSMRYLSGGGATNVSVVRTNAGSADRGADRRRPRPRPAGHARNGNLRPAGMKRWRMVTTASFVSGQLNPRAALSISPIGSRSGSRPARSSATTPVRRSARFASGSALLGAASTGPTYGQSGAPLVALLGGTEAPQYGNAVAAVAQAVAMPPSVDMLVGADEAKGTGEVERVLADAPGAGADPSGIDAILDGLPASGHPAMDALAAWHAPPEPASGAMCTHFMRSMRLRCTRTPLPRPEKNG